MSYGTPYMGSKSGIARWIVDILPANETLVDLFAGGCAVTHCAMLSGKWNRFMVNDICGSTELFLDAIHGKYHDEKRWISSEDFNRLKNDDRYVATCWSFGNRGKTYLYSRAIEPYKRSCHYAIFFNDWAQFEELCPEVCDAAKERLEGIDDTKKRRIEFGRAVVKKLKEIGNLEIVQGNPLCKSCHWKGGKSDLKQMQSLERLERLQGLQSLESLQRLQSLESLQRLQSLQSTTLSYEQVVIPPNSTVYCDIPYKGTEGYNNTSFDHEAFYEWCRTMDFPVFVSEYAMPEDFVPVASIKKNCTFSQASVKKTVETVFVLRKFSEQFFLFD